LKLAVVSSEYPPYHWGGVGSAAHALANQLATRGHEVHVFTRKHSLPAVQNHERIRMHMVPWLKFPMAFALSFGKNAVPEVNRVGGFDAAIIFGNMTLLRREDYAALKFPVLTKMCGTWLGERSTLRLGDISLFSVSGINDFSVLYLSKRYDKYEDFALLYSDAVITDCHNEVEAINRRMAGAVHSLAPVAEKTPPLKWPEPLKEGFMGMRGLAFKQVGMSDMSNFSPAKRNLEVRRKFAKDDERILLFVGRLAARKNVMEAARIFQKYLQKHPADSLLFIGKGNQEGPLRSFARKNGLEGRMRILQDLSFDELAVHYANADTFIFPSMWEGFGVVILEALASGLPVVSRPVGGAPEAIIDGRNGFLYRTEDEAVEALEKCAGLDRKWLVEDVQARFGLKEYGDKVEAICKKIAADGKTRSLPR
jgi:glycosyltransferase involved in cell wall biosynthesis